MEILELQKKINYIFKDPALLTNALTHSTYANEHNVESYERLEYLGDAIVDFFVGEYLFTHYPYLQEGKLTSIRSELVCEKHLSSLAKKIGLQNFILLGNGAEASGERLRESVLCDVFESHIAAIYLDAGMDKTKQYLQQVFSSTIDEAVKSKGKNYKTLLQEKLQKNGACKIEYRVIEAQGPIHDCIFTVGVYCNDTLLACASSKSKKNAEVEAAQEAYNQTE